MNTIESAVDKWPGILMALGVDESFLRNRHGPCPSCGEGKDRFRFDNKEGKGTYYCSQCGSGDGMSLAMKITGKSFAETAKQIDGIIGTIEKSPRQQVKKRDPSILLKRIHSELRDPKGTVVENYLLSRNLTLPDKDIFFHPSLAYYENSKLVCKNPAMVAIFRNSKCKPISYHVTYLTDNAKKATVSSCRKIMPPKEKLAGGSINLFHQSNLGVIGIAEGIETAIAAHIIDEIPVWSSANSGMLEKWEPPDHAKEIRIYGDNDGNFCGQSAAYKLANRLSLKGLKVNVSIPIELGDWNDMMMLSGHKSNGQ